MTKIIVVGIGYVGLSNAILLSQHHEVIAVDVISHKVDQINNKVSPIKDKEISYYLSHKPLNLTASLNTPDVYKDAGYIIIATPTDYNTETNFFDTRLVDESVKQVLLINNQATIIIKSTVPVGYTQDLREQYQTDRIIFSPEFLREGTALYDNLYPSRIVVGDKSSKGQNFANLLLEGAEKENIKVLLTDSTEAEAIKLFANSYLAMRVAFFNELDSYAESKNLNSEQILTGVSLDPRIGTHYMNPSFGYGGYCLPKDTKQLNANFKHIPQNLITAIVASNATRQDFITTQILKHSPKIVGIFRLIMKSGSDNFRASAMQQVMARLAKHDIEIIIYEPTFHDNKFGQFNMENNLSTFKKVSDIIVCNRFDEILTDVRTKVYTRDIYNNN